MKTTAIKKSQKLLKNYFFNMFGNKHHNSCACAECQEQSYVEYQQYYQQTTRWQTV